MVFCVYLALIAFVLLTFNGCYSFTGGSLPEHLKTLEIAPVADVSGFGAPQYKDYLAERIIENFRNDHTLEITQSRGDARLEARIVSIVESAQAVSPGELETERRVTVNCEAEFYDNTLRKQIWKRTFTTYGTYAVAQTQAGRNEAVRLCLEQIGADILLAVVSGW